MTSRIRSWLLFGVFAVAKLASLPRGTFCLVTTNPPLLLPLCRILQSVCGLRFGFLVWDLYPDHVVVAGYASRTNPLVSAWRAMNRAALRAAEVIITIGATMAARLRETVGLQLRGADRVVVIENWADTDVFYPREKADNEFAREQGLVEKFTVLYSGNLGVSHDLHLLLDLADRLADLPAVVFVVIAGGAGVRDLARTAQRRDLSNVRFLPLQPWAQVPLALAAADLGVVSQMRGTGTLSVPSKTYNLLASGVPLLALTDAQGDLAELVRDERIGLVASFDGVEEPERFIRELIARPDILGELKARARALAVERYSLDIAAKRLGALLQPVVAKDSIRAARQLS